VLPPPSLLAFVLLQGAPIEKPPASAACEDLQRIELALTPAAPARELCVSPGFMTNFIFDVRAEVELQDEVRFMEVTRGRSTFSFLPPRDITPGERIRLTARLGEGASQQSVTFSLVAHSGQATHQVEVYRNQRTLESYQQEVAQERMKNQRLREELERIRTQLEQVRVQLEQSGGLRELIANKTLSPTGVQALALKENLPRDPKEVMALLWGTSYRASKSIAVELSLKNSSSEPWIAAGGSLVDAHGEALKGLKLRQDKPIPPQTAGSIIVEAEATNTEARGELTLTLRDEGSRGITLAGVTFP
jgi:uncharacterized protein (TIGR02268 family)